MKPSERQVGGDHYKSLPIQPGEYVSALIEVGAIGWYEANAIKYLSRWKKKGGKQDLEKARHYIDLLLEKLGED